MSKRYGRNQKRKARQVEQDLREAVQMDRALLQRQRRDIDAMAGVIQDTRRVLSHHFATLPAQEEWVQHMHGIRLPLHNSATRYGFPDEIATELSCYLQRLETLEASGRLEPFGQLHMRLRTPTGEVGYSISPGAFRGFDRQRLADHLAREISRLLLADEDFKRFASIDSVDQATGRPSPDFA